MHARPLEVERLGHSRVKQVGDMNTVPIVFAFDNNLVFPACVCLSSLMMSAKETTFYDIFILYPSSDEFDRKTVLDLFLPEDLEKRIFPIGRLDYDTQGILLLTNDGELANKLISPASHVEKEYLARVEGKVNEAALAKLKRGVVIDGYKTLPADVYVREYDKATNSSLVDITIVEGKNHQVKKMCEAVGFPVKRLTRIRFGCISTEGLGKGNYRKLKIHEVKKLYGL